MAKSSNVTPGDKIWAIAAYARENFQQWRRVCETLRKFNFTFRHLSEKQANDISHLVNLGDSEELQKLFESIVTTMKG